MQNSAINTKLINLVYLLYNAQKVGEKWSQNDAWCYEGQRDKCQ